MEDAEFVQHPGRNRYAERAMHQALAVARARRELGVSVNRI
jgi:hypothetical protein